MDARELIAGGRWSDACAVLAEADAASPLQVDDLERLALCAALTGRHEQNERALTRALKEHQARGDLPHAARCAFWLGMSYMQRGEMAPAGGWFERAHRSAVTAGDCAERALVAIPAALRTLYSGDIAGALSMFRNASAVAHRFNDADALAMTNLGMGDALVRLGDPGAGLALLDEAMLSVTTGEASPLVAGIVYCGTIETCHDVFDTRRAHEWTAALQRWVDAQQNLVPFRGQCLVHQAEVLLVQGDWAGARAVATNACAHLSQAMDPAIGAAFYQLGEVQRLDGDLADAQMSYRRAGELGHGVQPGLALLRVARGEVDAAVAGVRRALSEEVSRTMRARLLPAAVEIMLAADDVAASRSAAEELSAIAGSVGALFLSGLAAHAIGTVMLADGDARPALASLRTATSIWLEIGAPYEAARTREQLAAACRDLGDRDGCDIERAAARRAFEELGAAHDVSRMLREDERAAPARPGGLTGRELEVLRLVAAGKTNRAIASQLVISEKTVARHVSNIFDKLGLSSRAAATAHAYEHGLV